MESAWSYQYPAHREGEGGDPRQAAKEHPRHRLEGTDEAVYSVLLKADGSFAFPFGAHHAQVVFALFKQDNACVPRVQKAGSIQADDLDALLDR